MLANSPPLLPVHLRVGLIGHRSGHLPNDLSGLSEKIREVLSAIKVSAETAQGSAEIPVIDRTAVQLTCLSSLADGADQICAAEALRQGYLLECPLPFSAEEYRNDFTCDAARHLFDESLAQASSVFELDGDRARREPAYDAAARVLLNRSDILIAIWDGEAARGQGGTAGSVQLALDEGIPVIHITAEASPTARVLWTGGEPIPGVDFSSEAIAQDLTSAAIDKITRSLLVPSADAREAMARYLSDRRRSTRLAVFYPILLRLFAGRKLSKSDFEAQPFVAAADADWCKEHEDDTFGKPSPVSGYFGVLAPGPLSNSIRAMLLPAYAWADGLSIINSNLYRSTYVFNFCAAATAVSLALFGIIAPEAKFWLISAEFLLIATVIGLTRLGRRREWHRLWLEERELAERLRHLRVQALVGSGGGIPRPRVSLTSYDLKSAAVGEKDWVSWYVRYIARALPLPNSRADSAYVGRVRSVLQNCELKSQISYHQKNLELMQTLEHRIHKLGLCFFIATLAVCGGFALLYFPIITYLDPTAQQLIAKIVTVLTALLPALGAALAGIAAQADLGTLIRRSDESLQQLEALDDAISRQPPTSLAAISSRVESSAQVMVNDLDAWRTIFVSRPLVLPS